ncbi:MAG: type II toxin-antitoxin system RelE/ParE family toxin [Bdellovibrionales bacterium]
MLKYTLTPLAEQDIEDILDYSARQFGLEQAAKYYNSLRRSFDLLIDNPRIGRDDKNAGFGMRRYVHEKHSIYYRIEDDRILILRVMHHSADPDFQIL